MRLGRGAGRAYGTVAVLVRLIAVQEVVEGGGWSAAPCVLRFPLRGFHPLAREHHRAKRRHSEAEDSPLVSVM